MTEKSRQYRTEIVRILRSQIIECSPFVRHIVCRWGEHRPTSCRSSDCTNLTQAGCRSVFRRRRIMRSRKILCTHYVLRTKRYGKKYASKMRKHDVCVVVPKVRQGRRTTESNRRKHDVCAVAPKVRHDVAQQRATGDKAVRRSLCGVALS